MVLKISPTRGMIIKIMFNKLNNPFATLSSRLNMLNETTSRKMVYPKMNLFRRISTITYLITLNISHQRILHYNSNCPG